MEKTRAFFIVSSEETNEEIFPTLEEARKYAETTPGSSVFLGMVRNAYRDGDGWNYDDYANTFSGLVEIDRLTS